MTALNRLRAGLDALYFAAGVLAALCLIAILSIVVAQMVARWSGLTFPGAPQYAGYAMAAASFLAFAHALNRGSHIRVSLLVNAVPEAARRWLDLWGFAIGAAVMWYFVWFAQRFVFWSWKFNEVSQGQDATPLWIPQSAMLIGAVILAVALTDNFLTLWFTREHKIQRDLVDQSFGE